MILLEDERLNGLVLQLGHGAAENRWGEAGVPHPLQDVIHPQPRGCKDGVQELQRERVRWVCLRDFEQRLVEARLRALDRMRNRVGVVAVLDGR